MHIPDGFLEAGTWAPAWLLSIGGIRYSLKKTAPVLQDRMVPLMGVMSAFIFAAQMVNFPIGITCNILQSRSPLGFLIQTVNWNNRKYLVNCP